MIAAAMKITFVQIPCDPGQVGVCLFTAKKPEKCKQPCRCVWRFCWTFQGCLVNGTRCWPLNSNRRTSQVASACKFFVYQSELCFNEPRGRCCLLLQSLPELYIQLHYLEDGVNRYWKKKKNRVRQEMAAVLKGFHSGSFKRSSRR